MHTISGNFLHGRGVFATGGYRLLLGGYARSPLVSEAGSPSQWSGGVGVEYTF